MRKRGKILYKKMRKCDKMRNKNLRKGRCPVFKRKIYSKMQEWKKDSNGKTALLIEVQDESVNQQSLKNLQK